MTHTSNEHNNPIAMTKSRGRYLCIENDGEINPRALTLLGGTTKRGDDNTIGMFGSGNKYALAFLLRNGIDFYIMSGERRIDVRKETVDFRETSLDVICIEGVETSLTTDAGPGWNDWQVFREIVCNAIDEGGAHMFWKDEPCGVVGKTRFYIDALSAVAQTPLGEYFLWERGKPLWCSDELRTAIYKSETDHGAIYRRGILIMNAGIADPFGWLPYDIDCADFNIDESRSYMFSVNNDLLQWRAILACNSRSFIADVLQHVERLSMHGSNSCIASESVSHEWMEALRENVFYTAAEDRLLLSDEREKCVPIDSTLRMHLMCIVGEENVRVPVRTKNKKSYEERPMTGREEKAVHRAVRRLERFDHDITQYNIVCGTIIEREAIALACRETNQIILTEQAFHRGSDDLMLTILEEYLHLRNSVDDCTREMQEVLLREIVTLMSRIEDYEHEHDDFDNNNTTE